MCDHHSGSTPTPTIGSRCKIGVNPNFRIIDYFNSVHMMSFQKLDEMHARSLTCWGGFWFKNLYQIESFTF